MRGHEHIIELRKRRLLPDSIFIEDYPTPLTDWFEHGEYPHVCVHEDTIETLDLRFLVGAVVHVSTESESRGKALLNACVSHRTSHCTSIVLSALLSQWYTTMTCKVMHE